MVQCLLQQSVLGSCDAQPPRAIPRARPPGRVARLTSKVTDPERSSVNLREHDPATSFQLPAFYLEEGVMSGAAPYLVAFTAMLISGLSALTLIFAANRFDPPDTPSSEHSKIDEKIAS